MLRKLLWIERDDGTLCADGYPIRIGRFPDGSLCVEGDGIPPQQAVWTLEDAKISAERLAGEMADFDNY